MKSEHGLKRIRSINIILWRSFTLFAVVMIAVVTIVCYGVLGSAFSSQAKNRVKAVGKEISEVIVRDAPIKVIENSIFHYQVTDGIDISIVNEAGEKVLPKESSLPENWSEIVTAMRSAIGSWEEGSYKVFEYSSSINYGSCIVFDNARYYLLVRYPLNIIMESVHTMQLYILMIALIIIVVAFIISYIVSDRLSRPIKNISSTANRLAKGDYSVEFASAEYEEIAKLSDTLNYATGEIKKSQDFQKELLANVSHDLRTPLTMIKAYASMIREISGNDPEKRDKHLQVIIDESDRLTALVNDILSASKVSSGLSELNKKVFNLTEFVYGIINKFGYLQETQGYKILVDIDPNLYTIADEEKIGQVIYNLVSNAVNYTGEDKTVYISLKDCPEQGRIKFAVRDTGKGITEDDLEHIWDRYYRSKDAHTRPVKGTGLGLNIVKIILQAHSFDFGVTSQPDVGSTFYVDFPVMPPNPQEVDGPNKPV